MNNEIYFINFYSNFLYTIDNFPKKNEKTIFKCHQFKIAYSICNANKQSLNLY